MMEEGSTLVHRIYSGSLSEYKKWYAVSSSLCCMKPSVFCSNAIFKVFPNEFKKVKLGDIYQKNGDPASPRWFNDHHRVEEVYVASAFGLIAGILRIKNPSACPFFKSEEFLSFKRKLNENGFESREDLETKETGKETTIKEIDVESLQVRVNILQAQLQEKERELSQRKTELEWNFPSPPPTPSPEAKKIMGSAPKSNATRGELFPPKLKRRLVEIQDSELSPKTKKRRISEKVSEILQHVNGVVTMYGESLGSVLGHSSVLAGKTDRFGVKKAVRSAFQMFMQSKGPKTAYRELLSKESRESHLASMRVPEWVTLLFKLKSRLSDSDWSSLTSLTKLGRTEKKVDVPILPLKNQIAALRKGIFATVKDEIGIKPSTDLPGFEVNLECVVKWSIRESRLHGSAPEELKFNLKLDGRPFFGKNQVTVGIVPLDSFKVTSTQSAKSVFTLAIANCKEDRKDIKKLMCTLNTQKDILKKNGISVDGKMYKISFKVTLYYKGLVLLMAKSENEDFQLGGGKMNVEFCIFCLALRACSCDLGPHEVCLDHFLQTKANIGGFKGMRDDLTCILEEDIGSLCLCALHCEMRNTEQLLRSLGLYAYNIGSLDKCNEKLKAFGPETINTDRITIKTTPGQETAVSRHNVSLCSMSGGTERKILANIEEIVVESLPHEKVKAYLLDPDAAKQCILNKVTFCERRKKHYDELLKSDQYIRDFGSKQEEITLDGTALGQEIKSLKDFWEQRGKEISQNFKQFHKVNKQCKSGKKTKMGRSKPQINEELSSYAATLTVDFLKEVCSKWKDIALIMRNKTFNEEDEHKIDIFDIQCKEWGFLLLEVFGRTLGTGDYGHLTIEHAPVLMRIHRSMGNMSNQGFEAAHKLQRQLYAKSTSHDCKSYTSSLEQIMSHLYGEMLLDLRLAFREAKQCFSKGPSRPFYYRGCGWKSKVVPWSDEDKKWILDINKEFDELFGPDFCQYDYTEQGTCILVSGKLPNRKEDKSEELNSKIHPSKRDKGKKDENSPPKVPPSSSARTSAPHLPKFPDIEKCKIMKDPTRGQLSSLHLPPVVQISQSSVQIHIVKNLSSIEDPLLVEQRPSQQIVALAKERLTNYMSNTTIAADPNSTIAIKLGVLGTFAKESLRLFQTLCEASHIRAEVCEEDKWLARCADCNTKAILGGFLKDSHPEEKVLQHGPYIMDMRDYTTLACERYLNGFAIDVLCFKMLELHQQSKAVYLPTYTQTWARQGISFLCQKIKPLIPSSLDQGVRHVLTTVHDSHNSHWGMLCFDVGTKTVMYDDGLKVPPPGDTEHLIMSILQAFKVITDMSQFNKADWKSSLPLPRFNMPLQPRSGEGAGSCGMGVILAIWDFIKFDDTIGTPSFAWKFEDMSNLRKEMMLKALQMV